MATVRQVHERARLQRSQQVVERVRQHATSATVPAEVQRATISLQAAREMVKRAVESDPSAFSLSQSPERLDDMAHRLHQQSLPRQAQPLIVEPPKSHLTQEILSGEAAAQRAFTRTKTQSPETLYGDLSPHLRGAAPAPNVMQLAATASNTHQSNHAALMMGRQGTKASLAQSVVDHLSKLGSPSSHSSLPRQALLLASAAPPARQTRTTAMHPQQRTSSKTGRRATTQVSATPQWMPSASMASAPRRSSIKRPASAQSMRRASPKPPTYGRSPVADAMHRMKTQTTAALQRLMGQAKAAMARASDGTSTASGGGAGMTGAQVTMLVIGIMLAILVVAGFYAFKSGRLPQVSRAMKDFFAAKPSL